MDENFYTIMVFETKIVMKKSTVVRNKSGKTELKTLARMELLRSDYRIKSTDELIDIFEKSISYLENK